MGNDLFVDFYELVGIEIDATDDIIEKTFRHFAKEAHPEGANADAIELFAQKMKAFETLTDLDLKSAYDEGYETEKRHQLELLKDTACIESDCAQRHRLLSLFYAKRRQSMEAPGISNLALEELANVPSNVLKFHIWYFREKGWVSREESGLIAITAAGVDKIESYVDLQSPEKNGHSMGHVEFKKTGTEMAVANATN